MITAHLHVSELLSNALEEQDQMYLGEMGQNFLLSNNPPFKFASLDLSTLQALCPIKTFFISHFRIVL